MNSPSPSGFRHAVVLAHPDANSFNAAIAATYCDAVRQAGQKSVLRCLYWMGFDPALKNEERPDRKCFLMGPDVHAKRNLLAGSQLFTFIFRIRFGMPPAMLTGYIHRVWGAVRALLGNGHPCTISTCAALHDCLHADPRTWALRTLAGTYLFRGSAKRSSETLHIGDVVEGVSPTFIEGHLERVRRKARSICTQSVREILGTPLPPETSDGS